MAAHDDPLANDENRGNLAQQREKQALDGRTRQRGDQCILEALHALRPS
jgi:hypothetical protein